LRRRKWKAVKDVDTTAVLFAFKKIGNEVLGFGDSRNDELDIV
jgi:hypothetical protein